MSAGSRPGAAPKYGEGSIRINLSGPDGNAFALISRARQYGRELGFPPAEVDAIVQEMRSGSYEDLLQTFVHHFGMLVTLQRE